MIKGVLLDLSGVIYEGDRPLAGAPGAIDALRAAGLCLRFVTNTTRMPRRLILDRLASMGLEIGPDELFTPARGAVDWLKRHDRVPSGRESQKARNLAHCDKVSLTINLPYAS